MKQIKSYLAIFIIGILAMACFDDRDEDFAFEPFAKVTFPYTSEAWTSIDNLTIEMASESLQTARVEAASSSGAIDLGTITFSAGTATLETDWLKLGDARRIDVIGKDIVTGKDFRTLYSISKNSPISAEIPVSAANDETITFTFEAATKQTNIKNVVVTRVDGSNGAPQEIYRKTSVNALKVEGSANITVPSAGELPSGESIVITIEVISEANLSVTEIFEVTIQ